MQAIEEITENEEGISTMDPSYNPARKFANPIHGEADLGQSQNKRVCEGLHQHMERMLQTAKEPSKCHYSYPYLPIKTCPPRNTALVESNQRGIFVPQEAVTEDRYQRFGISRNIGYRVASRKMTDYDDELGPQADEIPILDAVEVRHDLVESEQKGIYVPREAFHHIRKPPSRLDKVLEAVKLQKKMFIPQQSTIDKQCSNYSLVASPSQTGSCRTCVSMKQQEKASVVLEQIKDVLEKDTRANFLKLLDDNINKQRSKEIESLEQELPSDESTETVGVTEDIVTEDPTLDVTEADLSLALQVLDQDQQSLNADGLICVCVCTTGQEGDAASITSREVIDLKERDKKVKELESVVQKLESDLKTAVDATQAKDQTLDEQNAALARIYETWDQIEQYQTMMAEQCTQHRLECEESRKVLLDKCIANETLVPETYRLLQAVYKKMTVIETNERELLKVVERLKLTYFEKNAFFDAILRGAMEVSPHLAEAVGKLTHKTEDIDMRG